MSTITDIMEQRDRLYILLCKLLKKQGCNIWISLRHPKGPIVEGYFVLGINEQKGKQITDHLNIKHWNECKKFATVLECAPAWDGHTYEIALKRLRRLVD